MSPARKRKPAAKPTLHHRVASLEVRVLHIEARLEALAELPAQMAELTTLVRSTLMQQGERIDHLEARAIDKTETLIEEIRELGVLVRALSRVIETRPCLAGAVCGQEG